MGVSQVAKLKNLPVKICRLKEAFDKNADTANTEKLLSCKEPGVMLLQLASKFEFPYLLKPADPKLVIESLHPEIELDLRGTIALVAGAKGPIKLIGENQKNAARKSDPGPGLATPGGHAVITVGEAKSGTGQTARHTAKKQLKLRLMFLKFSLETIFENEFGSFIGVGCIFVPAGESVDDLKALQEDGVSYYFHCV